MARRYSTPRPAERRAKRGKALNVIPVCVADKQINSFDPFSGTQQLHPEFAHSGATVEDQNSTFTRPHFDTRSVASEKHGSVAGGRDRAACSPKANAHYASI